MIRKLGYCAPLRVYTRILPEISLPVNSLPHIPMVLSHRAQQGRLPWV